MGLWSVCFMSALLLSDDALLGIVALIGTAVGIWLGMATGECTWEFRVREPDPHGSRSAYCSRVPVPRPDVERSLDAVEAVRPSRGHTGRVCFAPIPCSRSRPLRTSAPAPAPALEAFFTGRE